MGNGDVIAETLRQYEAAAGAGWEHIRAMTEADSGGPVLAYDAMVSQYVKAFRPLAFGAEGTACYRADAGFMVHVKPRCRCER
jgi:hypothetical protein